MFDKIKNIKLENISVERKIINEENTQLIKKQEKIEEELKLLRDEYESIKHSNFFEMIFKKKEYEKRLSNNLEKQRDLSKKLEVLNQEYNNNLDKVFELSRLKDKYNSSFSFDEFGIKTEEEIIEFCDKENIEMTDKEKMIYTPTYSCCDVSFMRRVIKDDLSYIYYDKTMNIDLYCDYVRLLIDYFNTNEIYHSLVIIENLSMLLNDLKDEKFILENKDFVNCMFESIVGDIENDHAILCNYKDLLKLYNSDFSKELKELYDNKGIVLGIHCTDYKTDDPNENGIFKDGLLNSTQTGAIRHLDRTVFYDANFLQLLIRCGGNSCTYILAMPKGCFDDEKIPIWGSDGINLEANYVLPKYIYGMIDGSGKKREFIKNQILDLKEYKYLYCDRENEPINLSNNKQK